MPEFTSGWCPQSFSPGTVAPRCLGDIENMRNNSNWWHRSCGFSAAWAPWKLAQNPPVFVGTRACHMHGYLRKSALNVACTSRYSNAQERKAFYRFPIAWNRNACDHSLRVPRILPLSAWMANFNKKKKCRTRSYLQRGGSVHNIMLWGSWLGIVSDSASLWSCPVMMTLMGPLSRVPLRRYRRWLGISFLLAC